MTAAHLLRRDRGLGGAVAQNRREDRVHQRADSRMNASHASGLCGAAAKRHSDRAEAAALSRPDRRKEGGRARPPDRTHLQQEESDQIVLRARARVMTIRHDSRSRTADRSARGQLHIGGGHGECGAGGTAAIDPGS